MVAQYLRGGVQALPPTSTAGTGFIASTSFANPAVTLARAFSDTFAGIRPADVPGFVVAQFAGAMTATFLFRWLVPELPETAERVVVRDRNP
jgi:glycerol uptake facilitator-like aquaporin